MATSVPEFLGGAPEPSRHDPMASVEAFLATSVPTFLGGAPEEPGRDDIMAAAPVTPPWRRVSSADMIPSWDQWNVPDEAQPLPVAPTLPRPKWSLPTRKVEVADSMQAFPKQKAKPVDTDEYRRENSARSPSDRKRLREDSNKPIDDPNLPWDTRVRVARVKGALPCGKASDTAKDR